MHLFLFYSQYFQYIVRSSKLGSKRKFSLGIRDAEDGLSFNTLLASRTIPFLFFVWEKIKGLDDDGRHLIDQHKPISKRKKKQTRLEDTFAPICSREKKMKKKLLIIVLPLSLELSL